MGLFGGAYVGEWAFRNAIGEEEPWSWTSLVINVGASAVGSSIGRKLGQVFTNRATTKALTQAVDGGASAASKSPNAFSKAMSWASNKQTQVLYSDFGAGVYATGNKAGRGIANAVGGEAGVTALEQFGKNVDFAIMKGLTGGNAEAARQLIVQDDYYRFAVGADVGSEMYSNLDYKKVQMLSKESGEKVLSIKELKQFKKAMRDLGVPVKIDSKGKIIPPDSNVAVAFDPYTNIIYLKKDPTFLSAYHESFHAKQYIGLGKENYLLQSRLQREEYVYNMIMDSNLFNDVEKLISQRYIYKLRNGNWPPFDWKGFN